MTWRPCRGPHAGGGNWRCGLGLSRRGGIRRSTGHRVGRCITQQGFLKSPRHRHHDCVFRHYTRPSSGWRDDATVITAGQGFTPSSLATVSTIGTVQLTNSGGDAISMSESTTSPTTASLVVGSDGSFSPSANAAALNTELAADGSTTVSEMQSSQAIDALAGASAVYATASSSTDGVGVVIGLSPPGERHKQMVAFGPRTRSMLIYASREWVGSHRYRSHSQTTIQEQAVARAKRRKFSATLFSELEC